MEEEEKMVLANKSFVCVCICVYHLSSFVSTAWYNLETWRQVNAYQLVASIPFGPAQDDTWDKITVSFFLCNPFGKISRTREVERKKEEGQITYATKLNSIDDEIECTRRQEKSLLHSA